MYNSLALSTFTMFCNHHHYLSLTFSSFQTHISPSPCPASGNLYFVSMNLPLQRPHRDLTKVQSYICPSVSGFSFTLHNFFKVYPYRLGASLLRLKNIPLYVCNILLSIHPPNRSFGPFPSFGHCE